MNLGYQKDSIQVLKTACQISLMNQAFDMVSFRIVGDIFDFSSIEKQNK